MTAWVEEKQVQTQPERPDYDQALKRLLLRAHDGFLALIAPELKWRGELSPELPAVARRADLVWEVEQPNGQRGTLHIELQTKPEVDIGERLAEYAIRLWRRDHQQIRSLVVFLRPAAILPGPPFVINWVEESQLHYTFGVIRLWEVPAERILETEYYEIWPLAGLMAGVTADVTLDIAKRIAVTPLSQYERSELAGLLVLLASARLPRQSILDALRRNAVINELISESSMAGYFEELGLERGMQRGMQQGIQQGIQQGLRESVRLVLESRFGTLSEELREAIARADEATLEEALRHIATDALEQIRARFGLS